MSSHEGAWGFPMGFVCEHTGSGSRVMARVVSPEAPEMLMPVVSVPDPVLAHRLADLLAGLAEDGANALAEQEATALVSGLEASDSAQWQAAVENATAGRWPISAAAVAAMDGIQQEGAPAEAAEDAGEAEAPGETEEADVDEALLVEVDRRFRLRIWDPQRALDAALASGWTPAPDEERGEEDPQDLLGAAMWLADGVSLLPGIEILHEETEGRLVEQAGDGEGEAEDEGDDGWQLTPRTADALHDALSELAGDAYNDVTRHGDALVDPADESWVMLQRLPRITYDQDAAWRRQIARAADDLRGDLEAGQWPQPRCTAEAVCLYLAITDAEAYEEAHGEAHEDLDDDDYDWETCLDVLFDDTDFLTLFDPMNDADNDQAAGDLRPATWFTTFASREPRDPERGFR